MCSNTGLPTPGSEISILIKQINLNPSLVELWVDLDNGRKQIFEDEKEKIYIPRRRFYGSEGKSGDLCLVCIENIWHRARIISNQTETYNVFLIDQGRLHLAVSEDLAWGEGENFLLPPEIEFCVLANIFPLHEEWPALALKLLKCLPGRKFRALVQHILMPERIIFLEIPLVSKHICKIGAAKKMQADEFKIYVKKSLQLVDEEEEPPPEALRQEQNLHIGCKLIEHNSYFYPELLTNIFEMVTVTEVTDPHHVSCQLHIFSEAVKLSSEKIHKHYEEIHNSVEKQSLSIGEPCAARGTDGKWHRSLLKQIITNGNGSVEVFHVDDGKVEMVDVGDTRPLHDKFLRMPVVTYVCCLNGIEAIGEWTVDDTHHLKSVLLHQTLLAKFNHSKECKDAYNVTLYAERAKCINKMFLDRKGLNKNFKPEWDLNVPNYTSCPHSDGDKQFLGAQCKNNGLPNNNAKIQVVNCGTLTVSDEVQDPPPFHPITSSNESNEFDLGECVCVNVSCVESPHKFWCQTTESAPSLKCLMEELQNHCKSGHQQPLKWTLTKSIYAVCNPDDDCWYRVKIIASKDSPTVDVRFIDYGQTQKVSLHDLHPIDPAFLRLNALAFQCSLTNPSDPTPVCWPDASLEEFQKFVDMSVLSNTGLKCIIKATTTDEDGLRLNVVDLESASVSACNLLAKKFEESEAQKLSLRQKNTKMKSHKMLGLNLQEEQLLDGNEDCLTKEVEQKTTEQIKMYNSDGMCTSTDLSHAALELTGICNGHSKTEAQTLVQNVGKTECPSYLNPEKKQSVTYQWSEMSGDILEVYASCIVGPNYFWCQNSNTDTLDKVSKVAQEEGQNQEASSLEMLKPGMPCLALFSSDNQWCRAQVLTKNKNTLHVQFVDYGNESEVDVANVRSMPENLLQIPPQAFLCHLNNFNESNGSWDDNVYDDFYNLIIDKKVIVTILGVETRQENGSSAVPLYSVRAECEKEVINDIIQKYLKSTSTGNLPCEEKNAEIVPQEITSEVKNIGASKNSLNPVMGRDYLNKSLTEKVFASCISEPNYFWCQSANTEDIQKVSKLAQEAKEALKGKRSPVKYEPGSTCLALFPSDNLWYRAQVIKQVDRNIHAVFIDYGNECNIDVMLVRPLPKNLLEIPPLAFLCCLNGFNPCDGSWDEEVYDIFYNLLVDKPLEVKVVDVQVHLETGIPQCYVEINREGKNINSALQKYWKPSAEKSLTSNTPQGKSFLNDQTKLGTKQIVPKNSARSFTFKQPVISRTKPEIVLASCIVDPHFFWCQFANSEELQKLSQLSQKAGRTEQDRGFQKSLRPGNPCLALFPSDNQWYRAQVIKQVDKILHVLFIDYGNESEVEITNVRPLPQKMLEIPPQAFLCFLDGYDKSKGSWREEVYDDFYNLLVDKVCRLKVFGVMHYPEFSIPQYAVQIECDGVAVNAIIGKYWNAENRNHISTQGL